MSWLLPLILLARCNQTGPFFVGAEVARLAEALRLAGEDLTVEVRQAEG